MALLALGILRPFPRTRPLASSKTIVDSLSIDLDLPLSRLVSRKLSRIRLHDQDKVDHLCLFDLLRDFRNRGTGVGGGATRTWMFDENISARFCVHRGVYKVFSPSSTFFLTDDSCLHDLS